MSHPEKFIERQEKKNKELERKINALTGILTSMIMRTNCLSDEKFKDEFIEDLKKVRELGY